MVKAQFSPIRFSIVQDAVTTSGSKSTLLDGGVAMTNDFAQPVVARGGMDRGLNAISWSKICNLQRKRYSDQLEMI